MNASKYFRWSGGFRAVALSHVHPKRTTNSIWRITSLVLSAYNTDFNFCVACVPGAGATFDGGRKGCSLGWPNGLFEVLRFIRLLMEVQQEIGASTSGHRSKF